MPMEQAAISLKTFSLDILGQVHTIVNKPVLATKEELLSVTSMCCLYVFVTLPYFTLDGLENLEVMLHVIHSFGEQLPAACQSTCQEAWAVFDSFLDKYGSDYDIAERTTRVIRHGITLFGSAALLVASSVVARMSVAFEATGFPSYLWIAGKMIGTFGNEEDGHLRGVFQEVYERSTSKVASLLQTKSPRDIPDGTLSTAPFTRVDISP